MINLTTDAEERQRALDPKQSYIVQAPAGSGKTELLIQRFLVLLGQVKQPEEILGITFTKKSSAEMRARIINALTSALNDPEPPENHKMKTWHLAKKALHRDQTFNWQILQNPNRLRIQTIDSFNSYITKHLPILSRFGAMPDITDQPYPLYRGAVEALLSQLAEDHEWADAIAALLQHLDNDINKVSELLITMLAKRDQWLPYVTLNINAPDLRSQLESHLAAITINLLNHVKDLIPKSLCQELLILANFAGGNLRQDHSPSRISLCANLVTLPGCNIIDKPYWLGLAELLLTKDFNWRKRYDKTLGFPTPTYLKNNEEKKIFLNLKERMTLLIEKLSDHDELRFYLQELLLSPDCAYHDVQWENLKNLLTVLQLAVAELYLIFQQQNKIDYIENAQAALLALGTDLAPTDITLALDYQIQHILIDEFQDTSTSQYRLIEKITSGWMPDDGRTLFVVGDPMQSIYRFREAEVGLFIRTRKQGLNHIKLTPLTLTVNFRSVSGIVHWVNEHFQTIFSRDDNIATGAISYNPSVSNIETTDLIDPVKCHAATANDSEDEAAAVVRLIIQRQTEYPNESIAILVRSRSHLHAIIAALKKAQIPYRSVDIDPLNTRPVIQDLMALTRALLHPADRIAWLAILRAPWCGLTLKDLLILSGHQSHICLYERLQSSDVISQLSDDGQKRLMRTWTVLQHKMSERYRFSLRVWVESTWALLGGPACVNDITDLEDAKAFFNLLENLDHAGDLNNFSELNDAIERLYANPNLDTDNHLQIMTIHTAKGLEFDTVIIPHLERKSLPDEKQLLLWMEGPRDEADNTLILAPIHTSDQYHDSIYNYIKRQNVIKTDHENGRLLYVAATRAKKQLHLFFAVTNPNLKENKPTVNSLLHKLWPTIQHEIKLIEPEFDFFNKNNTEKKGQLARLSINWANPLQESNHSAISYHQLQTGFQLPQINAKITGIIIHLILQQMGILGIDWWQNRTIKEKEDYVNGQCLHLGLAATDLIGLKETVITAIQNTLQDPKGKWILEPHLKAQSEFRITTIFDNKIHSLMIDRTFIDKNGIRWIIDYKTSQLADNNLERFLNKAKEKYTLQLTQYAEPFKLSQHPIHLGLYFPLIPAWKEWALNPVMGGVD